jgi:hypothetical protein
VPITLGQGMLSSSIDIANNISFNGNVTIANSATSGTNNIQLGNTRTTTTINGALTLAGATTVNTETTFNSIVNIKGDTLANTVAFSGNIGYEATSAATYTIGTTGATALNIRYILRVNAASTITVPGSTRSQYITIRSTTTGLVTINMASGVTVILNGNSTTSTTTNLTTGGSITFYSILSSQYIQI